MHEELIKAPRRTLRVNGSATFQTPGSGSLVIGYDEALKLILAAESCSKFTDHQKEELPAIVSHWLQSPKESPILLDKSYRESWLEIIRTHCLLKGRNPASGLPEPARHPRPIHIDFSNLPFRPTEKPKFTFIDLFAGIGGFRIALQGMGGKCLFSSEWDRHAKETYFQNHGEVPFGDITKFTKSESVDALIKEAIPEHTILCGGFPCQPFSQAGLQRGFEDARGTLFFDILKIARDLKPKVLFLENVKRLKTHDGGKTLSVICSSLRELGYKAYVKVLRAYDFGIPQNRERVFIVAFNNPIQFEFPNPLTRTNTPKVGDILDANPESRFTISDAMWQGHKRRLQEHRKKGNGFGYSLFNAQSDYVNTISARYWKDGSEILIDQVGSNPRILTPRECARVQGYPEEFEFHSSHRYAYQQFGNSVAVPVVKSIAAQVVKALVENRKVEALGDPLQPLIF
jgi:DNA (cytosine-5)-methyltransferase 1